MSVVTVDNQQHYYATLISTDGCDRLVKTKAHLNAMDIDFTLNTQPSLRRKKEPNEFHMSMWDALTYKQTYINKITTDRHMEIVHKAIADNTFPILIMEDDVRFTSKKDFQSALNLSFTTRFPWNIFLFSCVAHPLVCRIPIGFENMHYVPTPLMAHAYMLNKKGARKLIHLQEKYKELAYDKLFAKLGYCIAAWPEVAYQCVTPHQLQAFTRNKEGGDWLLGLSNTLSISFTVTIIAILVIFMCSSLYTRI